MYLVIYMDTEMSFLEEREIQNNHGIRKKILKLGFVNHRIIEW